MAARRRAVRGAEHRRAGLGGCADLLGDIWADLGGDRRHHDEYFVSNGGMYAHVTLQMLIHLNGFFSVAWAAVWVSLYGFKYRFWKTDLLSTFLNPVLFAIWLLIEPLRLWFGMSGNLSEKVANLAAFFLLTVFPQLFAHLVLLASPQLLMPFEIIAGVIMLVILTLEAVFSFSATKTLINKSTAQFHLQHDQDGGVEPAS
mmetsp:Transcript_11556/g.31187  ORF Transcript_11556/g.31187 Transcript_11556/m.31187 type:complete len:201 (-) Transcript_11556:605-1207(-)